MAEVISDKLGHVIWWSVPKTVDVELFNKALEENDLGDYVTKISPKKAFGRSKLKTGENQLLRKVEAGEGKELFQLTTELNDGKELTYEKDTSIMLDLVSGKVAIPDKPDLEKVLEEDIKKHQSYLTAADLNVSIEKIITVKSDLFPIKSRVSIFIVPDKADTSKALLEKIENIVSKIKGTFSRVPVGKDKNGVKVMKEAVSNGLRMLLEEYEVAIGDLKVGLRKETYEKAATKVKELEMKIEGYSDVLEEQLEFVRGSLKDCKTKLKAKLTEIAKATTSSAEEIADSL